MSAPVRASSGAPDAPAGSHAHVLDNPAWAALTGSQSHLAEGLGWATRFHPDVAPSTALSEVADPASWEHLATLVGPGGTAALTDVSVVPNGWEVLGAGGG